MALQFASVVKMPGKNKQKRALVMEAVTRREQSLVLFHLMGKVFYNKRVCGSHFKEQENSLNLILASRKG